MPFRIDNSDVPLLSLLFSVFDEPGEIDHKELLYNVILRVLYKIISHIPAYTNILPQEIETLNPDKCLLIAKEAF